MQQLGVSLPRSLLHLDRPEHEPVRFPVIIKPRSYADYQILGNKNKIALNDEQWRQFRSDFKNNLERFTAQEVIPGDESCQWVCNPAFDRDSSMVSAFTFQRIGTRPARYGVTTLAIGRHNAQVKTFCADIGRALGYFGPAMFEFKVDPRSGEYCYIETNHRLGMCNWFDTSCGVHNAYNAYALAVGLPPKHNLDQQTESVLYINTAYDLLARLQSRLALYTHLRCKQVVLPLWAWRDPAPALHEFRSLGSAAMKGVGRRFPRAMRSEPAAT